MAKLDDKWQASLAQSCSFSFVLNGLDKGWDGHTSKDSPSGKKKWFLADLHESVWFERVGHHQRLCTEFPFSGGWGTSLSRRIKAKVNAALTEGRVGRWLEVLLKPDPLSQTTAVSVKRLGLGKAPAVGIIITGLLRGKAKTRWGEVWFWRPDRSKSFASSLIPNLRPYGAQPPGGWVY